MEKNDQVDAAGFIFETILGEQPRVRVVQGCIAVQAAIAHPRRFLLPFF